MYYNKTSLTSSHKLNIKEDVQSINHTFIKSSLEAQHLVVYKQFINSIFQDYEPAMDDDQNQLINLNVQILREIKKEGINVKSVTKKIAVLQGVLFNSARKRIDSRELVGYLQSQLENIVRQQLPKFTEEPKKRQSSLSKMYNYIREIGSSKQKRNPRDKSRGNIQDHSDKKSIQQIINKIIKPYTVYLLTVLKSFQLYSDMVNGSHGEDDMPFQWKLANWAHALGNIVEEVCRLGRYFEEVLIGVQLIFVYMISIDLTMFYDILQSQIQSRGGTLMQTPIDSTSCSQTALKAHQSDNSKQREYTEIKGLIEESWLIKESLNYIFFTPYLKDWRKMFASSEQFKYEEIHGKESTNEEIYSFVQMKQQEIKQRVKRDKMGQRQRGRASQSLGNSNKITTTAIQKGRGNAVPSKLPGALQKSVTAYQQSNVHKKDEKTLISYLQGKKKEISPQMNEQLIYASTNEQQSMHQLNVLSKTTKMQTVRKMRLMHLNSRDIKDSNQQFNKRKR